jgi:hypothetical protein
MTLFQGTPADFPPGHNRKCVRLIASFFEPLSQLKRAFCAFIVVFVVHYWKILLGLVIGLVPWSGTTVFNRRCHQQNSEAPIKVLGYYSRMWRSFDYGRFEWTKAPPNWCMLPPSYYMRHSALGQQISWLTWGKLIVCGWIYYWTAQDTFGKALLKLKTVNCT